MNFLGYRRPDGRVGTRNYVGIISTVVCANEVAKGIADKVSGKEFWFRLAFVLTAACTARLSR